MNDAIEVYYQELCKKLNLARDVLSVADVKELRDSIRSFRPLAILRDELGPFRSRFKEFIDEVYEYALPLVIVFCAASMEQFLRDVWEERYGQINKNKRKIFSNPKKFGIELRNKLKKRKDFGTLKANAVAMKRHVILHKDGVIDKDAKEVFMEAKIQEVHIDDNGKLKLTVDNVKRDIEIVEEFAKEVKNALI